jgi:predicted amidohydrolase
MNQTLRVAAAVTQSTIGRIDHNFDTLQAWTYIAVQRRVDLICFPELNLCGYACHQDAMQWAQSIPGPITDRLQKLADACRIGILAGLIEQDAAHRHFISHVAALPGRGIQVYRKTHISPPERPYFCAGNQVPVYSFRGFRFGIQLCYDAHFPELTTRMAIQGADIIFIPHASPRGAPENKFHSWMRHLPARAFDNAVYIIANNPHGGALNFPGIALAIDPGGHLMAKRFCAQDDLLIIDVDADVIQHIRGHRMRYFLPNRRPQLY